MLNNAPAPSLPGGSGYLKQKVHWYARAFVGFGVLVIVWLALGCPGAWTQLKGIAAPTWIASALTAVFSVVVVALDSLPGPDFKAVLVFWRRRDPLPGCRAFERSNLNRDTRINQDRLREVVGGKFPRGAREQNSTWYGLYKSLAKDPTVQAMHFDYLLFRDLAWLSIVLAALALANAAFRPSSAGLLAIGGGGFAAFYVVFGRAAAQRGRRFVNQVLVTVSVALVKIPKKK